MENDGKTCNRIDERSGTNSWGLWLKATSFLGNRSSVHAIRQGGGGGVLAAFLYLTCC